MDKVISQGALVSALDMSILRYLRYIQVEMCRRWTVRWRGAQSPSIFKLWAEGTAKEIVKTRSER